MVMDFHPSLLMKRLMVILIYLNNQELDEVPERKGKKRKICWITLG
jgi:hypothetical protein